MKLEELKRLLEPLDKDLEVEVWTQSSYEPAVALWVDSDQGTLTVLAENNQLSERDGCLRPTPRVCHFQWRGKVLCGGKVDILPITGSLITRIAATTCEACKSQIGSVIEAEEARAAEAPKKIQMLVQTWTEYEMGWSCRPDGFTLHRSREARNLYVKEHNMRQHGSKPAGHVPHEYTKADSDPYWCEIEEDYVKKQESKAKFPSGFWGDGNNYPAKI